jgi:hypothetical protein
MVDRKTPYARGAQEVSSEQQADSSAKGRPSALMSGEPMTRAVLHAFLDLGLLEIQRR